MKKIIIILLICVIFLFYIYSLWDPFENINRVAREGKFIADVEKEMEKDEGLRGVAREILKGKDSALDDSKEGLYECIVISRNCKCKHGVVLFLISEQYSEYYPQIKAIIHKVMCAQGNEDMDDYEVYIVASEKTLDCTPYSICH